jgi:lipopolysaccharide export system protein LptA
MIHKVASIVAFLVLCCILADAQESPDKPVLRKEPGGALVWGPVYKLGADQKYLSLGGGSDQPIEIKSRKVNFRNIPTGKEVTFKGNVKVKQGDVTLTCSRLVIVYDEKTAPKAAKGKARKLPKGLGNASQIRSIAASGNVKIIQNERMTVADEALYDNVKRTIILKGKPSWLLDGKEELNGGQIIIDRGLIRMGPAVEPIRDRK